jgi:hypothetical protein
MLVDAQLVTYVAFDSKVIVSLLAETFQRSQQMPKTTVHKPLIWPNGN